MSVYYYIFFFDVTQKNKEIIDQLIIILAAFLSTLIWTPTKNNAGTNIAAIKLMPIRKEL